MNNAVATLRESQGVTVLAVSPFVETDPVGGPPQPDYLNAVVVIDTDLDPHALLELAHHCESLARRQREERWGPRTLDVDVLAYDDLVSEDPLLILPHPRATQRAFVMVPWAAVDPDFSVSGRTVDEWANTLDSSGVRTVAEVPD
jgi:2-amino-4-hydroxy-6-hydroxymethyldihydropteridine diphosphokinase